LFQKPNVFPDRQLLYRKYVIEKKTDKEIASEFGVDRTYIVHARKYYNIPKRKSTGEIGESLAINELEKQGFSVMNMNNIVKTFPFDLLVNHYERLEIKSSTLGSIDNNARYTFCLSEKPENNNIESKYRIKLPNGRTRKLYRKTCDFLIFTCLSTEPKYYIVPSNVIPDKQGVISIPEVHDESFKFHKYKNNWHLLMGR
jgi:hypothetical protein